MNFTQEKKPQSSQQTKRTTIFFGKLWKHTIQSEDSEHKGETFLSGNISNQLTINGKKVPIKDFTIGINDNIQIWKNNKRKGKRDADYSLSLSVQEAKE